MKSHHSTTPRDVFMWLVSTISLYVVVTSLITMIFNCINFYFPDALDPMYQSLSESLRWQLALLVILYPLYIWVTKVLQSETLKDSSRRDMGIRKWLMYLTLFLTTIAIVVDLVTLVYYYLGGEVTTRFLLKVLTVLVIAGVVFFLYLWDLRSQVSMLKHPKMKWFVRVVIAVIAVIIVGGFVIGGSPKTQRMVRFDQARISDLQNIQYQIINYWQTKEKLPAKLSDLQNDFSGYTNLVDQENGKPYEYGVKDAMSFELCAVFDLSSDGSDNPEIPAPSYTAPRKTMPYQEPTWDHGVGRSCFFRTIDPQQYPPFNK